MGQKESSVVTQYETGVFEEVSLKDKVKSKNKIMKNSEPGNGMVVGKGNIWKILLWE